MIGRGDAMKDERQRKRVSPKPVSYIRRITFDYFSRILEKRIYWKDRKILIFEGKNYMHDSVAESNRQHFLGREYIGKTGKF